GEELSRTEIKIDALEGFASIGDKSYATLAEAIAAAQAGDTVKLTADQSYTGYLIIDGITFDLNGFELTVNGALIALKGANIIDSAIEKGKLLVATKNSLVLSDVEYPMLPIWMGDGYIFAEVLEQNKIIAGENSFNVQFRPMLIVGDKSDATGDNMNANVTFTESIFTNGASDNGLTIEIFIHCMKGGVEVEELHFIVTEDLIKTVYGENKRFSLTIKGATAEFADEYVVTIAIKSDRNVSFETTLEDTYKPTASPDAQ
ncbi:MAG: hypothetical protein J6R40_06265, partial [Clostridia bacterium]|nr:hypothetical protein [Clostridia bacterium]